MALRFMEGFDMYSAAADIASMRGCTVNGTPSFLSTGGRFGGGCMEFNSNTDEIIIPLPTIDAGTAKMHWAAWIKVSDLPAAAADMIRIRNNAAGNSGCGIRTNAAGDLIVTEYGAASTADGTVAAAFADLGWHHVEMEHRFDGTSGSLRVWVDGILGVNVSSVDTINTGTPSAIDQFRLHTDGTSSFAWRIDDLVIWDETGSDFVLTHMDEHRIEVRRPNADTAQSDFTPSTGSDNYAMVDENGLHDGDSTFVESTTIGHLDLYDVANLGFTPTSVHAVAVHTRAKKTDVGSVAMKNHIKSGTTDTASANHTLTASYAQYTNYYGKNPDTTSAWDETTFNAVQIGFEYEA